MNCNVCKTALDYPIYDAHNKISLTSLCQLHEGNNLVFACSKCSHIQTKEISDILEYYDKSYRISLNSEEEDQIYQVVNGNTIYRTRHQVETLISKMPIPLGGRVLDYGCAKATTMKQLIQKRSDLNIHLFDVSEMYISFWKLFLQDSQWSTYKIPSEWLKTFDLVTSFFAFEHIVNLQESLAQVAQCLKPGGIFYFVVPNTFTNPGDFVVVDHVNHFTKISIQWMLNDNGFTTLDIDEDTHFGAFIVTAALSSISSSFNLPTTENVKLVLSQIEELAIYWANLGAKINTFEILHQNSPAAIYGAGFYGSFIFSLLKNHDNITYFLDKNPFQQGKTIFNKLIISPDSISSDIKVIYVGLNPKTAKNSIADVDVLHSSSYDYLYL